MTDAGERTTAFQPPRMTWTPRLIGSLVLLALSLVLILQNWDTVTVNIFFWEFDIRLAWALLGVFLLGAATAWLVPRVNAVTRRSRVRVTTEEAR